MRRTLPLALLALLVAVPAWAQHDHAAGGDHGLARAEGLPDGWLMRLDRPGSTPDMVSFRTMEPGWHVTTTGRGAGIFWQPDMTAEGEFRLESTIHLMKPAQHAEAFGMFVGGQDLTAEGQRYLYFLVRQNGQFLIKRRSGEETENVVGWTPHQAIPSANADAPTRYDLAIEVGGDEVTFSVNGTAVHTMPRSAVETEGAVGLRVNHMLDTHIAKLQLTRE